MQLPGEIALEELAHAVLRFRVVKEIGLAVRQALVNVPAAARVLRVPLRHEARHDAEALADFLGRGFEEHRAIGGLERFGIQDGGFVHAGPGFGMQPLDRDAELRHFLHQRLEERLVLARADQRVAEHAGRDRLRLRIVLGGKALRRFAEIEPLVFNTGEHLEALFRPAREHLFQELARAYRRRSALVILEIGEEETAPGRPTARGGTC